MKKILNNYNLKISLYYLLLLVLSIFFYYGHILNADEGVILNGSWNLFNNLNLYTDFFEIIPPGSFYLIYYGFKLFGPYYSVANIISLLLVWGSAIGIYKSLNLIKKDKINYVFPIIFILSLITLPIINHNLHNLFFLIWSVFFFLQGLKNNSNPHFFLSGLLGGLATIFLQQKGLTLISFSFLFLLVYNIKNKKIKNIIIYSIGAIIPILLLFLKWPPKLLYQNLIAFPMLTYWEVNKTSFLLLIVFFLILVYLSIYLKNNSTIINYLLGLQFFLLLSVIPLPDFYHIVLIIFPTLILIPSLFINNQTKETKIFILVVITIITFSSIKYLVTSFTPFYSYSKNKSNDWIEYINKNCPGKYIYSGPFFPNLYFETKKLNVTNFDVLIEKQNTPNQFSKALNDFKKNEPSCAVLSYYENISKKFKHQGNNQLETYIKENYTKIYSKNNIFIYKK
jgi:hypothetical protein